MATAKGIAFAAGIPLWAVSSLAALAAERTGFVVAAPSTRARARSMRLLRRQRSGGRGARDETRRRRAVGRCTGHRRNHVRRQSARAEVHHTVVARLAAHRSRTMPRAALRPYPPAEAEVMYPGRCARRIARKRDPGVTVGSGIVDGYRWRLREHGKQVSKDGLTAEHRRLRRTCTEPQARAPLIPATGRSQPLEEAEAADRADR